MSTSVADSPPFEYEPLGRDQIRLITETVAENGEIRCKIEVVDVPSEATYNALSYTWGDPRPKGMRKSRVEPVEQRIYLNGRPKNVKDNLYRALIRLTSQSMLQDTPIWIDAVCINQDDPNEKSSQVSMMGKIYEGAIMVIAWLGETDEFTEAGLEALRCLAAVNQGLTAADYAVHQRRELSSYSLNERHWQGLVAFFCRAWFTRVWVIQEVTLAKKLVVLFGESKVAEDTMRGAATFLARAGLWFKLTSYIFRFSHDVNGPRSRDVPALGAVIGSFAGLGAGIRKGGVHPKLVTLFGRGNDASDPRDHIYAMAALVKLAQESRRDKEADEWALAPAPAYVDEVEKVIIDWARWMIKDMDNYMLFSHVEDHSHRRLRSLPSWVPDLSVSMMPNTFRYLDQHNQWRPSGDDVDGLLTPIENTTHMKTEAGLFDTVVAVAEPFNAMEDSRDYTSISQLPQSHQGEFSPYHQIPSSVLASTMTAGNTNNYDPETLAHILSTWITAKSSGAASIGSTINDATARQQVQWFDAASGQVRRARRLFLTRRGYIGIAAQSALIEDAIWILPGAATPFVFRADPKHPDSCKLVGEAFVNGIMEGQLAESLVWREMRIS